MNTPTTSHKKTYDSAALIALAIVFVALTIVAGFLLRGMRLDLTQNKLYTIAPGTEHILSTLDEPVHLYYFFSQQATASVPSLRAYAQRVRELLEEMSRRSKGKLKLTVIDPQPFSEDEDRAGELGLTAIPFGGAGGEGNGGSLYFGLAGTNSTDGHEAIPLFQPEKEEFLEYDVASLVHKLAHPKKPVVGLMSTLPVDASFDQQTGQMSQGWAALSQVRELYDVRTLASDLTAIDKDVDVLLLIHPKDLPPQALYAIDQFVLRGGKLLAFVDPLSMQDRGMGPMGPMGGGSEGSDLGPLLPAWGIDYDRGKVLADAQLALAVATRRGQPPSRHLGIIGLGRGNINPKDVVSGGLDSLNFMTAGVLSARKGATANFEPLLHSSTSAALLPAQRFAMLDDPQSLLDGFKPTGVSYTIAARVHGKLNTAYPAGAPVAPAGGLGQTKSEGAEAAASKASPALAPQLKTSQGDANIIIVADTDFLADMLWVRTQNVLGQTVAVAWANNGDFLTNALDNLAGSSDLISVRGRQSFFRPFDKVDALRRQADEHLRVKEQELNRELQDTERKLSELQSGRNDKSAMVLTPEQQAELTRFQEQRLQIRKGLRDVRRNLQVKIDRLGTVLKVLNIAAIPVLVAIAALLLAVARRRRLKRGREAVGRATEAPGAVR